MEIETIKELLPVLTKIISRKLEKIQGKLNDMVFNQESEHSDPFLPWESYDDYWGRQLPSLIGELEEIQVINSSRMQLKADLFDLEKEQKQKNDMTSIIEKTASQCQN